MNTPRDIYKNAVPASNNSSVVGMFDLGKNSGHGTKLGRRYPVRSQTLPTLQAPATSRNRTMQRAVTFDQRPPGLHPYRIEDNVSIATDESSSNHDGSERIQARRTTSFSYLGDNNNQLVIGIGGGARAA